MKKLWLLLLLVAPIHGQVTNPSIIPVSSAPSGACSTVLPIQLLTPAGTLYSCQSGTWGTVGGGGGGGVTSINTVSGAFTFTGGGVSCTSTTCTFSGTGLSFPATVSGTTASGGIPYFSNTTTLTSSALLASGFFLLGGGAGGAPTSSTHLDDGHTTASTITSTEPIAVTGNPGLTMAAGTSASGVAGSVVYTVDATNGYAEVNENNTGLSRICTAGNSQCVTSQFISSLTTTGSSGAATVTSGVLNIPQYSGGGLPTGTTGQTVYYASGGTTGTATSAIYIGGSSISSPVGIGTTTPVDITDFDNTTGFIPALVPASNTTLSSSATSSQTTFTVASTTGYPTQGVLLVGAGSFQGTAELVIYTGVSGGNTFTGLTRGAFGSVGTAQASSNTVQLVTEIHAETLTSTPWLVKLFGGGVMYYPSMNYINAAGASPATGIQTYYNSAAFYQTLILSKSGNSGGGLSGAYIQGLLNGFTLSNQSNATTVLTEDGLGIPGYYTAAVAVTAISTTIAPVSGVVQLTGTAPTALATITAPANSSCTVTGISCQITFLGVGFATVTTGNIANVVAASADMTCTYLLSATKWYCK